MDLIQDSFDSGDHFQVRLECCVGSYLVLMHKILWDRTA